MPGKKTREARRAARKKALVQATISINKSDSQTLPCILKDVSSSGCQIVGSAVDLVNGEFILSAELFDKPRLCAVVWRKKRAIGACFRT